jgi:hypothetical protein
MKMQKLFKTLVATSTLVLSLNASAALIFNFEDHAPANDNHTMDYMLGGYVLTVEAFNGGVDANIHTGTGGLGVTDGPGGNLIHSPEMLTFSLDRAFDGVVTILFSAWNQLDVAEIDGSTGGPTTFVGTDGSMFDFGLAGSSFSVTAFDNNPRNENDSFRVREIRFTEALKAIPEPSTLALFSLALLAFGSRLRRKA